MYEMPYHYTMDSKGRTYSPVLRRMVKLTPAMERLVAALNEHGYVDPIRDGRVSGTIVALMRRGILREAKGRAGRHYPATTPEQVWDEAHAEYTDREWIAAGGNLDTREDLEEGWGQPDGMLGTVEAESTQTAQDIRNGNYTIVMGEPICTRTDGSHANHVEPVDGMSCDPDGVPEVEQERYIPTAEERATEARERALADLPPAPVCLNTQTHGPHRIAGTFRDSCPGYTEPIETGTQECPAGPACSGMAFPGHPEHDTAITPAEERTGVSDAQASIADEVAALHDVIASIGTISHSLARHLIGQRLDRIAALVPQRATDRGDLLWQHSCGRALSGEAGAPPLYCSGAPFVCTDDERKGWRALYTVAGR